MVSLRSSYKKLLCALLLGGALFNGSIIVAEPTEKERSSRSFMPSKFTAMVTTTAMISTYGVYYLTQKYFSLCNEIKKLRNDVQENGQEIKKNNQEIKKTGVGIQNRVIEEHNKTRKMITQLSSLEKDEQDKTLTQFTTRPLASSSSTNQVSAYEKSSSLFATIMTYPALTFVKWYYTTPETAVFFK